MKYLVLFFALVCGHAWAEQSAIELEQYYFNKIDHTLKSYFDEKESYVLSVKADEKKVADKFEDLDMAYITLPSRASSGQKSVNLNIAVKMKKSIEPSRKSEITDLIKFSLQGVNAKIEVSSFDYPANSEKEREAASTDAPVPEKESFDIEKLKPYIYLVLVMSAILIFYLSFKSLSSALGYAADGISSGLGQLKNININSNEEQSGLSDGSLDSVKTKETVFTESHIQKNLHTVQEIVKNYPSLFFKIVGHEQGDYQGVSWIMTQVDLVVTSIIEKGVNYEKLKQALLDNKPQNYGQWLQQFVQRLYVEKMKDKSLLNQILTAEERIQFFKSTKEEILNFAKRNKTKESWRLYLEFVSSEDAGSALKQASQEEWQMILKTSDISKDEMKNAFNLFISQSNENQSIESKLSGVDDKILLPILDTLSSKTYEEEKKLMDTIEINNPILSQKLKKEHWTFDKLLEISETDLKIKVKEAEVEELVSLILVLPEAHANLIKNSLPDTNKKIIVLDLVDKTKERLDESTRSSAYSVSRQFLKKLKDEVNSGQLTLGQPKGRGANVA